MRSAGEVLQYLFSKNATSAKLDTLVHQRKQHVLSLLTDGYHVFHLDHEFTVVKVRSGLLTGPDQLSGPWCNELALYD
ncbi:MAG TPA: hypothetical protein VG498_19945 [Terriglobales bacterium]|nr:hypothetical protein [Terriglobales bacterium]